MREILFRGKDYYDKEWVYGALVKSNCDKNYYIIKSIEIDDMGGNVEPEVYDEDTCLVNIETIGEFTGLLDKKGNKIFEGDIVKVKFWSDWGECEEISTGTIQWDNGKYIIYISHYCMKLSLDNHPEMEVVGNIFEN